MSRRFPLVSLLLVSALAAACGGQDAPSGAVLSETAMPSALPPPTMNPCTAAVTRLGGFAAQIAENLVSLRPLVVAARFDSAETVRASRRISATLTAYVGLEPTLRGCSATADLERRVEVLRSSALAALDKALSASITDARVQRDAGVRLFGLLPEVLSLSQAARAIADDLGIDSRVAQVPDDATQPIGSLAPLPTPTPRPTPIATPKPPPPPSVVAIRNSFFGSGVSVSTYRVTGSTRNAIFASIEANGPYSKWLKGNATALTKAKTTFRFHFETSYYGCQIVIDKAPAIVTTYTIVLPRWAAPTGVSASTIQWWNSDIRDTATHEKVHVSNGRAATKRLNAALAESTCATASSNLTAVEKDWQRADCEFDMREYGAAAGLSLKACLAQ